jgi:phosphatidylserine decarboxylase
MGVVINLILVVVILIILFLLNFYRDPKRLIPKGNNIVSPADGKVIQILKIKSNMLRNSKGIFGTQKSAKQISSELKIKKGVVGKIQTLTKDIANECYLISIFMNVFDVHVNRAPIDGKIESIKYSKGEFFNASDLKKSLHNEKNEIIIQNKKIKIKAIQIAGFLARKIKCFVKSNQKINKGQKIGMIVLGSQVSLIIPAKVKLKIKIRDKVKAGSTIIAYY